MSLLSCCSINYHVNLLLWQSDKLSNGCACSITRPLTMEVNLNNIFRWFQHCMSITEFTYTHLAGLTYYTPIVYNGMCYNCM